MSKPCWKRSTDDQKEAFSILLREKLNKIRIPEALINCQDPHCNDSTHVDLIDTFTVTVLDTIDDIAETTLTAPVNKSNYSKSNNILPGWNCFVKPYKEDAVFWHNIWTSAGRPLTLSDAAP